MSKARGFGVEIDLAMDRFRGLIRDDVVSCTKTKKRKDAFREMMANRACNPGEVQTLEQYIEELKRRPNRGSLSNAAARELAAQIEGKLGVLNNMMYHHPGRICSIVAPAVASTAWVRQSRPEFSQVVDASAVACSRCNSREALKRFLDEGVVPTGGRSIRSRLPLDSSVVRVR
jgi:hypothetical protein